MAIAMKKANSTGIDHPKTYLELSFQILPYLFCVLYILSPKYVGCPGPPAALPPLAAPLPVLTSKLLWFPAYKHSRYLAFKIKIPNLFSEAPARKRF
jgi:hypothetical protein